MTMILPSQAYRSTVDAKLLSCTFAADTGLLSPRHSFICLDSVGKLASFGFFLTNNNNNNLLKI